MEQIKWQGMHAFFENSNIDIYYWFILHRQLASKTKTYYYHFDHLGSEISLADHLIDKLFLLKKLIGFPSCTSGVGVSHFDELFYLFK